MALHLSIDPSIHQSIHQLGYIHPYPTLYLQVSPEVVTACTFHALLMILVLPQLFRLWWLLKVPPAWDDKPAGYLLQLFKSFMKEEFKLAMNILFEV